MIGGQTTFFPARSLTTARAVAQNCETSRRPTKKVFFAPHDAALIAMFGVRSTAFGDTSDEINRHIRNLVSQVMAGGGIPFTGSWEIYPFVCR